MIKYNFIISLILISVLTLKPEVKQDAECKCCGDEYRQFDFWIGDWVVFDTDGKLVGSNRIVRMEDHCVLQEKWKSASSAYTGTSYNYYDANDQTWNQLWLDNQGGNLKLKGERKGNQMILRSELLPGEKVDFFYNKITWTKNEDGSVTQLWEVFDKNHNLLQTSFNGIYRKRESTSYNIYQTSFTNTTTRRAELLY